MMYKTEGRKIVRSWPGEGTGETIYQDEDGNTYRPVSQAEASLIRNSTGGQVFQIKDGRVR